MTSLTTGSATAAVPVGDVLPQLGEWVRKLTEQEMPIFAQTVGEINRILANEEYSSLALGRVILQDPSMTAKVLKLSNSVYYNPGGATISTISRAVVVLGFNAVQAICISIVIIEALVKGRARDRVMRELARSIHAASQARAMASAMKDPGAEEIFIASLLMNLGQMAFWCFAGPEGDVLDRTLSEGGDPAEAEKKVLGFKLNHLTGELAKEWKLTGLIQEALKGKASKDPKTRYIDLAHRVVREVENGWNTPELKQLAVEASKLTGKPIQEVGQLFHACAEEAVGRARSMGATAAARMIPVPQSSDHEDSESVFEESSGAPKWCEPDPMLQLKILREVTATLHGKPDLNVILEMVLEGIHRGAGMDRTVFALITPRRNLVKAKFVLGSARFRLSEQFQFEVGGKPMNFFAKTMTQREPIWVEDYKDPQYEGLMFGNIFEAIDRACFVVQPVTFGGFPMGLFYADRHPSGRKLDSDAFESFKMFVHQANLGLEHVAKSRAAG